MEIQDDRWGCWISLKELARLRGIEKLVLEFARIMKARGHTIYSDDRQDDVVDVLVAIQNAGMGK